MISLINSSLVVGGVLFHLSRGFFTVSESSRSELLFPVWSFFFLFIIFFFFCFSFFFFMKPVPDDNRESPETAYQIASGRRCDLSFWKRKLFSVEDPHYLHKTLGFLCVVSFAYRYYLLFTVGSLGLSNDVFSWLTMLLHFGLSTSSLIFHVLAKRIISRPMVSRSTKFELVHTIFWWIFFLFVFFFFFFFFFRSLAVLDYLGGIQIACYSVYHALLVSVCLQRVSSQDSCSGCMV